MTAGRSRMLTFALGIVAAAVAIVAVVMSPASPSPAASGAPASAGAATSAGATSSHGAAPSSTPAATPSVPAESPSADIGSQRPSASATASPIPAATRWAIAWTAVRAAADGDATVRVTVGPRYPLAPTGASESTAGVTWLEVSWTSPSRHGRGWVREDATTETEPDAGEARAGINALSATLADSLADLGKRVGVVVQDTSRGVVYSYNPDGAFITASSIKVPIMLAVMARAEDAGRALTAGEKTLLTAMIEQSDNDAASSLYRTVGGRTGMAAWASRFGIEGFVPEAGTGHWGYSTIRPSTMASILERLRTGGLANKANSAYARYLMEHVIASQRFGVGTGSPKGSTVAMKNGWVVGPDGLWAVNSSGIVTSGETTWVISVYTRGNATFEAGSAMVTRVAKVVGAALK